MRQSNLDRQKWRATCRTALSHHIQSQLGINIEPAQVRLIPGPDDPYRWSVLPEKQFLFSKNLSDHSIKGYKEIYSGIGKTFEATHKTPSTTDSDQRTVPGATIISFVEPDVSFSGKINWLHAENLRLNEDLERCKSELLNEKQHIQDLKSTIEYCKDENRGLRERLDNSIKASERYAMIRHRHLHSLLEVLPVLEDLKKEISIEEIQPFLMPEQTRL